MSRATESEISLLVLRIAASNPSGIATFKRSYTEIPTMIKLTAGDTEGSNTRNGEPMWKQIVRNIKSHDKSDDNFISQGLLEHVSGFGYRATSMGHAHLKKLGF